MRPRSRKEEERMRDGYGREIDYLRISLTDKCNLRCGYCMPAEGIRHLSHADILSMEELSRLVKIMSGLGIRRVRLTGGEPLVRKGVTDFIRMLEKDCGIRRIAMTSNGMLLTDQKRGTDALSLKEAGLKEINISLDTLCPETFRIVAGTEGAERVKRGINAAVSAGLKVKLNCVPLRGINDTQIPELLHFASALGIELRMIELMPLGCGVNYEGIPTEELIERLEGIFGKASADDGEKSGRSTDGETEESGRTGRIQGPAVYYRFEKLDGRVGFISPMTHRFCAECNRVRLTASGFLKLCLQYPDGVDLKEPLRNGASDEALREMITEAVRRKPRAHSFGQAGNDSRKMVEIGG